MGKFRSFSVVAIVLVAMFFALRSFQSNSATSSEWQKIELASQNSKTESTNAQTSKNKNLNSTNIHNNVASAHVDRISSRVNLAISRLQKREPSSSLSPGPLLQLNHQIFDNWQLAQNFHAKNKSELDSLEVPQKLIGNYALLEATTPSNLVGSGSVVFDPNKKQFGIVTGVLIVILKDFSKLSETVDSQSIVDTAPNLNTVFVRDRSENLEQQYLALKSNPAVESVRMEIFVGNKQKL